MVRDQNRQMYHPTKCLGRISYHGRQKVPAQWKKGQGSHCLVQIVNLVDFNECNPPASPRALLSGLVECTGTFADCPCHTG